MRASTQDGLLFSLGTPRVERSPYATSQSAIVDALNDESVLRRQFDVSDSEFDRLCFSRRQVCAFASQPSGR